MTERPDDRAGASGDRRHAPDVVVDELLSELSPQASEEREQLIGAVLARLRAEKQDAGGSSSMQPGIEDRPGSEDASAADGRRSRVTWRLSASGGIAAVILLFLLLIFAPQTQPALAEVTLERAVAAARAAVVRHYRVLIERSADARLGPRRLAGELYYRGGGEAGRFRADFDGPLRRGVSAGFDGAAFWLQGPFGRVRSAPTPVPLERLLGAEAEFPLLQLDTALERLQGGYDVVAARGETSDRVRVTAVRRPSTVTGPDEIELLVDEQSGVIDTLEATWTARSGPGPTLLRLELFDADVQPFDEQRFAPPARE